MTELSNSVTFDPKKPVYVIKQFFYGSNDSSIRYASDHPLRLDQIPPEKRTSEYIKQGRIRSNIPTMVIPDQAGGIVIEPETVEAIANPLEVPEILDNKGEVLPASTPTAIRKAAANNKKVASSK
jgi:hypothetical protein